jgi:hypothetical protein
VNPTRIEIADAFRHAKAALELRDDGFICHALDAQRTDAARGAAEIVAARLYPHYTYSEWLEAHDPEVMKAYHASKTAFKEARLGWLDALIEEFSA